MSTKHTKKADIINGRISLLFFYLLIFAGLLWAERFARYRYDLIFRPMLIWLLPALFGAAAIAFIALLVLWIKGGKKDNGKLFSPGFLLLLPIPLMAGFLLPWLTLFLNGLQFFRLATELIFYATLGGYIGYIGYYTVGSSALAAAAVFTWDILSLFYFYDRFLSPASMILNTEDFGYMDAPLAAILLIVAVAAGNLAALPFRKKCNPKLPASAILLPAGLTVLTLGVNGFFHLPLLAVRLMIFGSIGLIILFYIVLNILKKRKKN